MAALCGSVTPSASAMHAIVDAVPIVLHVPAERDMPASADMNSCNVIVPALTCSDSCQTTVPEPMSWPRCLPLSIGPPVTAIAGTSQLAAPISSAGVVLSQPTSSTTPSIGLPRIASSTSMLARLRVNIAVGRRFDSPLENTGNSTGSPPASITPRRTCSASLRKCALHGVSSDHVLQMPITGLPWNSWSGRPWFFIQLRYMKPFLSALPNQAAERSGGKGLGIGVPIKVFLYPWLAACFPQFAESGRLLVLLNGTAPHEPHACPLPQSGRSRRADQRRLHRHRRDAGGAVRRAGCARRLRRHRRGQRRGLGDAARCGGENRAAVRAVRHHRRRAPRRGHRHRAPALRADHRAAQQRR